MEVFPNVFFHKDHSPKKIGENKIIAEYKSKK